MGPCLRLTCAAAGSVSIVGGLEDRTSIAIDRALGRGTPIATTFEIRDVEAEQADAYLYNSSASELWRRVSGQRAFRELATMPFTLFLLEEALPSLSLHNEVPDLPALYRAAVISWLHRDRGAASVGSDRLLTRLEGVAESTFTGLDRANPPDDDLIVNAGLLQRIGFNRLTFRHFSIFEYFIACVLDRQLAEYSATLLSRLNLVYMYNVNRFLIPLLLGGAGRRGRRPTATRLNSMDEFLGLDGRVSTKGFRQFIDETHWRGRDGYGIWTIKTAEDGTTPFEGEDHNLKVSLELDSSRWSAMTSLSNTEGPVTGVSWYDAFQCCRWAGGRLPTAEELACVSTDDCSGVMYEWSSSWTDERSSRIAVVRTSGQLQRTAQGLNPDMRSQLVGFRIVPLK
jgi:hypothetical protein